MEKFLPVILYGMDLVKYYIGNKFFFEGKMKRPWIAIVGGLGLFFVLSVFSFTEAEANLFAYFFAAVVSGIMMEGKIKRKVTQIVCLFCIICCSEEVIRIVIGEAIKYDNIKTVVGSLLTTLAFLVGAGILRRAIVKLPGRKATFKSIYIVIALIGICLAFTIGAIQFTFEYKLDIFSIIKVEYITILALICIILLIVLNFYLQKLYNLLEQTAQTERNLKEIQTAYYQSLLKKEEETRRYRHDMHNHLLYIKEMANSEGANKTKQYVDRLEENWGNISSNQYETGNMVLNILLHYYLTNLEGIKISVRGVCKRELRIDEVDLCTIFSNLIQNAAEELKGRKEGYFVLEIEQGQENTRITVRNTTDLLLAKDNQELTSSKQDKKNHGIGLKNVKQMVEKYNGDISWSADGKEFTVIVTMKI